MDIKQELIAIHQELDALSKQAAYQVDVVRHKIRNLNDKNEVIMAAINDTIAMAQQLKRDLSPYVEDIEQRANESDEEFANRWANNVLNEMEANDLGPFKPLIDQSERSLFKVRNFAADLGDISKMLIKEVGDIKEQRELRFVAPARDAKEKQKDPLSAALNAAKNVVRKVVQQT